MIYRLRVRKSAYRITNLSNFYKIEFGKRVIYWPHWTFENMLQSFGLASKSWEGRVLSIFERPTETRVRHILQV